MRQDGLFKAFFRPAEAPTTRRKYGIDDLKVHEYYEMKASAVELVDLLEAVPEIKAIWAGGCVFSSATCATVTGSTARSTASMW